jgi:hypothetical protein
MRTLRDDFNFRTFKNSVKTAGAFVIIVIGVALVIDSFIHPHPFTL